MDDNIWNKNYVLIIEKLGQEFEKVQIQREYAEVGINKAKRVFTQIKK